MSLKHLALKSSLLVLALGACEGERVTLNERMFELPGMTPRGGGCTTWNLTDRDSSTEQSCGPGATGACFSIHQTVKDDTLVITIGDRNGRLLQEKRYDEAFFASGKRDEFTITAPTGEAQLFRYWGARDAHCAPLEDTGETVPKL